MSVTVTECEDWYMVGQIINNESIVTLGGNVVSKNVINQGGAVRSKSSWSRN